MRGKRGERTGKRRENDDRGGKEKLPLRANKTQSRQHRREKKGERMGEGERGDRHLVFMIAFAAAP